MSEAKIKDKTWNKELEPEIYNNWKKNNLYKFNKNSKKPVYSIDTPPPYVNTPVILVRQQLMFLWICLLDSGE